jgi:hypothetical protein
MQSILFGKVVDVKDPEFLNRVRVSIPAYTDEIANDDLPWYYPTILNYLPVIDDSVQVTIMNKNIVTGFYGRKIDLNKSEFTETEYENYLEIYKRLKVQLTYIESLGIQFINDTSHIQIKPEFIESVSNETKHRIEKDKYTITKGGAIENAPLGDKTVEQMIAIVDLHDKQYKEVLTLFDAIKTACSTPILAPIKIAITAKLPISKKKFTSPIKSLKSDIKKIVSKLFFFE